MKLHNQGAPVEVSNLDKVFYPATGFTKGDVLRYYERISEFMLPHLAHRALTVKRYPDGVDEAFFYEKRCPARHPLFVSIFRVSSSRFGAIDFPMIDNLEALVWMANRAAIEFHTCLFRDRDEQSPTMMVFDLDPGAPATLLDCLDVGIMVRDVLADLGLKSFAKTSGGKGLHIGVPLQGADFPTVKNFARSVSGMLAEQEPKRVTGIMAKDRRGGRVFIDWSQNDHGKTTACAYTLRARKHPTVSAPVAWEEIETARRRNKPERLVFEADQMPDRVKEVGDLFSPTLTLRQRLPRLAPRSQA